MDELANDFCDRGFTIAKNLTAHRYFFSLPPLFSKVAVAKFLCPVLISKLNSAHNSERNSSLARMEINAGNKKRNSHNHTKISTGHTSLYRCVTR